MTKTVFCRKYQKELEALPRAPFPGDDGEKILATVSKQAWMDWLKHQTMMINEKHLNVLDPEAQAYLASEREKFMSGDDYEKPEGYVAPDA